jgi:hypothetical protein
MSNRLERILFNGTREEKYMVSKDRTTIEMSVLFLEVRTSKGVEVLLFT